MNEKIDLVLLTIPMILSESIMKLEEFSKVFTFLDYLEWPIQLFNL
jgi:hypothetical protein